MSGSAIEPPFSSRSDYWRRVYDNAVAKGATADQAERLADAVVTSWKRGR